MRRLIQQLAGWRSLFPKPAVRPRERCFSPSVQLPTARPTPLRPPAAPAVRSWCEPIDGTSTPLVRPYLLAHEREETARLQRLRRDILWWAAYGVDLDTRDIHAYLGAAS